MKDKKLQAAVEAILFASGDAVQINKIANVLETDVDTVDKICQNLKDELKKRNSGLQIVKLNESYQMCTCSLHKEHIEKILELKKNTPLSNAAMEVLAIIAYNEPVTRAFVDQVRGVDCAYVIGNLCKKGLVEERGRLELPGRPLLYGTTDNFLRCFGLESLEFLPKIPKDEIDSLQKND